MNTYIQLAEPGNDNRRVFQVPTERSGSRAEVLKYGVLLALKFQGVWSLNGTCVVRDARYREILDNTPILGELK